MNLPHDVGDSRPAGRFVLPGAPAAADPAADTTVRPAGEPQVLESWPTIGRDAAQHKRVLPLRHVRYVRQV